MQREQNKELLYMDITTDFGFKKLFSDPEVMKKFLNLLIREDDNNIEVLEVQYINVEDSGAIKSDYGIRYDLLCKLNTGEEIIVEMQNQKQKHFEDRIHFYLGRALVKQGMQAKAAKSEAKRS